MLQRDTGEADEPIVNVDQVERPSLGENFSGCFLERHVRQSRTFVEIGEVRRRDVYPINCHRSCARFQPVSVDDYFSSDTTRSRTSTITITGVSNVMPKAMNMVSTNDRYLSMSVIIVTPGGE